MVNMNEDAISCRDNYLPFEGPSSDSNFVNIHLKQCFHGNSLLAYGVTCLILSGMSLHGVRRIHVQSGRKMGKKKKKKKVVPDLRVDRFSVQYAKAVSKLSSNRPYFYDQSWL